MEEKVNTQTRTVISDNNAALLIDVNALSEVALKELLEAFKGKKAGILTPSSKKEPSLKEAIETLCNTLKDRNLFEDNGLKPQMLTTKKLEILKTIANLMRIDWDEVVQDDKIISLELKLFKSINK